METHCSPNSANSSTDDTDTQVTHGSVTKARTVAAVLDEKLAQYNLLEEEKNADLNEKVKHDKSMEEQRFAQETIKMEHEMNLSTCKFAMEYGADHEKKQAKLWFSQQFEKMKRH